MRKSLIFVFIISNLILFNNNGNSQTIKNVSVVNEQGHVRITWEYNGSETFEILRDLITDGAYSVMENLEEIDDFYLNSYIDTTAEAHIKPRAYKIGSGATDIVSTYHLSYNYDSCLQLITLSWVELNDPNEIIVNDWIPSQFSINIIEDGSPIPKIDLFGTVNEYTINNLKNNADYIILIETQWQGQEAISLSNPISFFTEMPVYPTYINAVSTVVDGKNTNIKFDIDPISELDTYKLLKSDSQTGDFDTVETYTNSDYELIASHNNSDPDTDINYYKLISLNQCGNETTNSNTIHNIVLNAEITDFDVSLSWNKLNENVNEKEYEVYRTIDNLQTERIHSFNNFTSFDDNIESFQNYGQFCYFIRAIETGTSADDYSQSNTACVYLEPKVFIPEAFTPNDDGLNDEFKAIFSFIPKEFDLIVYNRWGNKVFETGDYSEAWNGKVSNGNTAPTGSYIYYLRLKSPNDQVIEQRGSVMVINP